MHCFFYVYNMWVSYDNALLSFLLLYTKSYILILSHHPLAPDNT